MSEPHGSKASTKVTMHEEPPEGEGIYQWQKHHEVPEHLEKYWTQRYLIWDRYDEGVWMTEDSWFGVTPETIANTIAVHISEAVPEEKDVIIDAFAGVGGNAIAFAREGRWKQVFAIEKDPATMKCAKHNAKIYGVDKKIVWITGDCFDVIPKRFSGTHNAVIFASPPWGGTEYTDVGVFDLSKMLPYSLDDLYRAFTKITKHLILYLPRTSDLNQIARYAPEGQKLEVTHYCIKGASKALCVYFGDYNWPDAELEEQVEEMAVDQPLAQPVQEPAQIAAENPTDQLMVQPMGQPADELGEQPEKTEDKAVDP